MTRIEVFREDDDEHVAKEKTRAKDAPEEKEKERDISHRELRRMDYIDVEKRAEMVGERIQEKPDSEREAKESPPGRELTLDEALAVDTSDSWIDHKADAAERVKAAIREGEEKSGTRTHQATREVTEKEEIDEGPKTRSGEYRERIQEQELSEAPKTKEELRHDLEEPPHELEKLRQTLLESLDKQMEITSAREIRAMSEEEFRGWFLSVDIIEIRGVDVVKAILDRDMFAEVREQEKFQKNLETLERLDRRYRTQYPGVPRILQDIKRVQEKEWIGEIERIVPFSPEVLKVKTRLEELRVVLSAVEGGEEKYRQFRDEVDLWARVERLRDYIGNDFSVYAASKYLGFSNSHHLQRRLDISDPYIPKTIRVLSRESTAILVDEVRGLVDNKADVEFLSSLSRNYETLRELGLDGVVFERIEEIASRYFSFSDSDCEILRATEDSILRTKILPAKGISLTEVVEKTRELVDEEATDQLLEKVKASKGAFVIDSRETYALVLRSLPMTLAEPSFDSYHREMKGRLLLEGCIGNIERVCGKRDYTSRLERFCNNWLETVVEHQRLLKECSIQTVKDVQERISWYYDEENVRRHRTRWGGFQRELEYTERNIIAYSLLRVGVRLGLRFEDYDMGDIQIPRNTLYTGFNNLLKLAVQIPKDKPEEGWRWTERARIHGGLDNKEGLGYRVREGWIKVPIRLRADNVGKVVEQLGMPTKAEEREQYFSVLQEYGVNRELFTNWKENFGEIVTFEQKMDAFGYLIGVMLSDGSIFDLEGKLGLSSSYYWSKEMGDYFTYCWCSLGIPSRIGKLDFRHYESVSLFPVYTWKTIPAGFFGWFHKEVLGLPEGKTHTEFCSEAEWIVKMPREFRIAVIQGFFDGDGNVDKMSVLESLGASTGAQTDFMVKLLNSIGLQVKVNEPYENWTIIAIEPESFLQAVELPVFRRSKGKQDVVERLSKILASRNSVEYSKRHNIPYQELIRRLGSNRNRSPSRIAQLLYDLTGTTSRTAWIRRILERDDVQVDWVEIRAFFKFLKQMMELDSEKEGTVRGVIKQVCEQTGYESIETGSGGTGRMRSWFKRNRIPSSVRYALSNARSTGDGGCAVQTKGESVILLDKDFLERYEHIAEVINSYEYKREEIERALGRDYKDISSHPRLNKLVQVLEEQLDRLTKSDSPDVLIETMRLVQEIGKLREPVGVDYLIPLLEHEKVRVRGLAVVALSRIGGRKAVDALLDTFPKEPLYTKEDTKDSMDLRILWIRALGTMRDPQATDKLSEIQNDSDERIKQASIKALGKIRRAQERATEEEKRRSRESGIPSAETGSSPFNDIPLTRLIQKRAVELPKEDARILVARTREDTFTETLQSDAREEITEIRLETQEGEADIHRTTTHIQEPLEVGRTSRDADAETHQHTDKRTEKEETSLEIAPISQERTLFPKDREKPETETSPFVIKAGHRGLQDFATRYREIEDLLTRFEAVSPEYRREVQTARIASEMEKIKRHENISPLGPRENPPGRRDTSLPKNRIRSISEGVGEGRLAALEHEVRFMKLVSDFDRVTGREKTIARYDRIERDIERLRTTTPPEGQKESPLLKGHTERSETPPTTITRQEAPSPTPPMEGGFEARIDSLDSKTEALREWESTHHRTALGCEVSEPLQGEAPPPFQTVDRGAVRVFERAEEALREDPPSPEEIRASDAFLKSVESEVEFLRKIDSLERQAEELKLSPSGDGEVGVRLEELEHEIEKLHEKAFTLEEKDTGFPFDAEGREGDVHVRHSDFEEGNPFAKAEQALREDPPSPEKLRESDARIDEVMRSMVDWEEDTGEGRAERGFG